MTGHRSRLRTTPETYARASLLHDGARLPLATVADALGVAESVAARMIAFGRLGVADQVIVVPPGCGPHLGSLVIRTPAALAHLDRCAFCQRLDVIMLEGIAASRARWTIGADHRDPPVEAEVRPCDEPSTAAAALPRARPSAPAVPVPPPLDARAVSALVPPPPPPPPVYPRWPDPTVAVVRALSQQVRIADPDAVGVDAALRTQLASPSFPTVTLAG